MNRLGNIAAALLTLCAVVTTALLVRRELFPSPPTTAPAVRTVDDWEEYAAVGQRYGSDSAPVTLVEFSDFQCPFCRSLATSVSAVLAKNATSVRHVFRHYPLTGVHSHAFAAAIAAECAGKQGRFRQYHDALFAQQDSIGKRGWGMFALDAGVSDTLAFSTCVRDSTTKQIVERDIAAGAKLGLTGTPGLLVNERFISGTLSEPGLQALVDETLKKAPHGK
jgi:protein-disulfide isomerase